MDTPQHNAFRLGIAGSTGFIGSHLVRDFVKKGIPFARFAGDAHSTSDIERYFSIDRITHLVFLIGTFNPPFDQQLKTNVLTLQNFLETGKKYGLKKIVFSSTGAVYGEPKNQASVETDPLIPNTLYGLSKVLAETTIHYYARNSELQFVILRFPSVYGEKNTKGAIYQLVSDSKKGEIQIAGDGNQKRNFLHVSDACDAIEKSLHYPKSDIFNITSPVFLSINDVVQRLKTKYAFTIKYISANNRLKNLLLDDRKARNELMYDPKITDLLL